MTKKTKSETPKVEAPKVEAPKVEAPKVEAPKVEAPKVEAPKVSYLGQAISVKLTRGAQFEGVCTGEREITGQKQVLLKIKGQVSRYFNVEDVEK